MTRFSPSYIAVLADGLPDTSRVMRKESGIKITMERLLAAYMADKVANITWMLSEDGKKGVNAPKFLLPLLLGEKQAEQAGYDSPEEFLKAMKKYEV